MTGPDETLAALAALHAVDDDERLEVGVIEPGLLRTAAGLAEIAAEPPPPGLAAAVLRDAVRARPPGRPPGGVGPCTPAEAFARTVAELEALLDSLTAADWTASVHGTDHAVRDVVVHLVGAERVATHWLLASGDDVAPSDHPALTAAAVADLDDASVDAVATAWRRAADDFAAAAGAADPELAVPYYGRRLRPAAMLVSRTFELWAHMIDITTATGRDLPRLDPNRMALLSGGLMQALATLDDATAQAPVRFVLTGDGGGVHDVAGRAPDGTGATIVGDVVDICRAAARRLAPDRLTVHVDGDPELAERFLRVLGSFALD
ncbi:MAG: maleylpyruvate isomerase family mycothiol-dependent enzyme [Jatrophihabitans sp.]|uniref:maleylpyruvate isomerase family mycothiol-dependent enzyme n=1 Tax=Jatrophihabitans sp. TaxID=1932789 RepID=UPI003F81BA08